MAPARLLSAGFLLLAAAGAAELSAIPPPPEQTRLDCQAPVYASDTRSCADPELRALDEALGQWLDRAGSTATEPTSMWMEGQAAWFRRRGLCAMKAAQDACLRAAYGERTEVLRAIAEGLQGEQRNCTAKGPLANARIVLAAGGTAAVYRGGVLQAIALPPRDAAIWKPYVTISANGRHMTLELPNGSRVKC